MKQLIWSISALFLQVTPVFSAEVFTSSYEGINTIGIYGYIIAGDFERVSDAIESFHRNNQVVQGLYLASPGGLVSEATKIGRLIRKNAVFTYAPEPEVNTYDNRPVLFRRCAGRFFGLNYELVNNSAGESKVESYWHKDASIDSNCTCASACSLIWFSGLERTGEVGVHRSYFNSLPDGTTFTEFSNALSDSQTEIAEYLAEMRISNQIFEILRETASFDLYTISVVPTSFAPLFRDGLFEEYLRANCPSMLNKEQEDFLSMLFEIKTFGFYFDRQNLGQQHFATLSSDQEELLTKLSIRFEQAELCVKEISLQVQRESQQ